MLDAPRGGIDVPARPEDDAIVIYTSGSSSRPKSVPLSHRGIIENGFAIGERQGYNQADLVLLAPPLFWSYGSANALSAAMTHGATLVLQSRFEPGEALDRVRRSGLVVPPGTHEPPPEQGIVLAVGPGLDWWAGAGVEMPIEVGDHVVFPASAGVWVEVDEERLLVCRVTQLLGVLESAVMNEQR